MSDITEIKSQNRIVSLWLTWVIFKAVEIYQVNTKRTMMHKEQFSMIRMAMLMDHILQDLSLKL